MKKAQMLSKVQEAWISVFAAYFGLIFCTFFEDKAFKHLLQTQECQNIISLSFAESFEFMNTHPS